MVKIKNTKKQTLVKTKDWATRSWEGKQVWSQSFA